MSEQNPNKVASDCRRLSEQLRIEADRWSGGIRRRLIRDSQIMMRLARVAMSDEQRGHDFNSITETCDAAREIIVTSAVDRIDSEWAAMQ